MRRKGLAVRPPDSEAELEKIARGLLRAADVGDRLPTPQEDLIRCAELVHGGVIDLEEYRESRVGKISKALASGLEKVMGLLDVREKTIYISPKAHQKQVPFLIFHEVSHKVIPWQVEVYDYFEDNFETLDPSIKKVFEHEANTLGSKLLFQCDRLKKQARDYQLGIGVALKLADDFGASYHSCLRHYVATHDHMCCLMVLRKACYAEEYRGQLEVPFEVCYAVQSEKFAQEFDGYIWPVKIYSDHPLYGLLDATFGSEVFQDNFKIGKENEDSVDVVVESWTNSFNHFLLIKGRRKPFSGRKKVVVAA